MGFRTIAFIRFGLTDLLLIGLGCAASYPCLIHAIPARFDAERSRAIIGVQMAGAYIDTSLMPPLFGLLTDLVTSALYPVYLLTLLAAMVLLHEQAL